MAAQACSGQQATDLVYLEIKTNAALHVICLWLSTTTHANGTRMKLKMEKFAVFF